MKLFNDAQLAFRVRLCFGLLLALFALPLWVTSEAGWDTFYYTVPLVCLMQAYLVVRLRNAQMLLILTLYAFLYFSYLIPYFYNGSQLSEHREYQSYPLFCQVLYLFYLFYAGLTLSAARDFNPHKIRLRDTIRIECEPWKQVLFVVFLFAVFAMVIRQGTNVLGAENPYQAYMENLESNSALPMFMLLFMFFTYFVVSSKAVRRVIYTVLFAGLLYYSVTRGYRVLLAPLGFIFFLLFLDGRIHVRWIVVGVVAAYVSMLGVNAMKMGDKFEWGKLFSEQEEFILSHHADNLYVSAAAIGLVEEGKIDFTDRVRLNMGFFAESVVPATYLPLDMKYPLIISARTTNGGGGLCLAGAYMMWGYAGVLLFGFLLGEFIRRSYLSGYMLWRLLAMVVLLYSANWFSYDFHVILRFSVFAWVIYYLLKRVMIK